MSTPGSSSRKRARENETEGQRHKREKAAERQRRKRERDRNASNAAMGMMAYPHPADHPDQHQHQDENEHQTPQPPAPSFTGQELSPEELARRERVRTAARERQRKHRQLVKARKMRELGLDMGNDILPGMDEVHYRVNADGQYHQVMPHELHPAMGGHHEPPFPQGQPLGGQTFASTLLLSFSCAPLLKQHLLRTLSMTNEELASLEPIIAEAWDHWDHQRRMQHYAEQAAKGSISAGASGYANINDASADAYQGDSPQPNPNDFRARFQRPLVAPSPFRTFTDATQTTTPTSSTTGSGAGGPSSEPIDPHLTSAAAAAAVVAAAAAEAAGTSESRQKPDSSVDSDLGQARGEAEGLAGRLERG